ncbi:MAG: FAD-binding oxidoreductase [Chloroflexi bacterium]|nr:MAG: FAD-binding oxidoreductase [Chloroflexota bacterium]
MISETIPELDAISGRVIRPNDPEYDKARTSFYGGFDPRPGAIVRVADANDVARGITIARESGAEFIVRGGGHGVAGYATPQGGIVLDLRDMRALDIDAEGRSAWAETGLTAAEYTTAADAHGLATGFGDTGSVGIGGLTLGGGVGYLVRKHGLTIDDLLAADVVTADGQLRHVDAQTEPDLFWAIRGGGGNFGVATRFRYRLHPLAAIVGGMMMLPATADVIQSFIALAEAAPDELSTIANVMPAPPMPFVPTEHHGKLVIFAMMCYAGAVDAGERAIAPFRALAAPIVDMVKPSRYPEMYPPDDPNYHPIATGRTFFIDSVDRKVADTIVDQLNSTDAQMRVAQLRVLGGAMARVPVDDTAFAHRRSKIMVNVAALYGSPDQASVYEPWVHRFVAALKQSDTGAYVNFLVDEGEARIRDAYPGKTWDRLRSIKRRYDPTNFFRLNQNIPPSPP